MFRDLVTIVYVLALAIGLGGYSAAWVTDRFDGFGALVIGVWSAYPDAGGDDADPYARARAARTGELALGPAEGLRFAAGVDSDGRPLSGQCRYRLEGRLPASRLWTLRIVDADERPIGAAEPFSSRTHSRAILWQPDGSFAITISDRASAGNWLHLDHAGPVSLTLTLYDTAVAGATALAETPMPAIRNLGCRA